MAKKRDTTSGTDTNPANRDPITKAPGAHPVGVGAGAGAAGAAGAAIGGAVGGPIGAVVGAAVGAVAGGLGGKAAAESVNPTIEDTYWRDEYRNRPYATKQDTYETWQPAYRYGWEAKMMHEDRKWDEVEPELGQKWSTSRGASTLDWERARQASRDAYERQVAKDGGVEHGRAEKMFDKIRDDLNPRPSAAHTGEPISRIDDDPLDR